MPSILKNLFRALFYISAFILVLFVVLRVDLKYAFILFVPIIFFGIIYIAIDFREPLFRNVAKIREKIGDAGGYKEILKTFAYLFMFSVTVLVLWEILSQYLSKGGYPPYVGFGETWFQVIIINIKGVLETALVLTSVNTFIVHRLYLYSIIALVLSIGLVYLHILFSDPSGESFAFALFFLPFYLLYILLSTLIGFIGRRVYLLQSKRLKIIILSLPFLISVPIVWSTVILQMTGACESPFLLNEDTRDLCLLREAKKTADYSICYNIKKGVYQEDCFWEYSSENITLDTVDEEMCERFKSNEPRFSDVCYSILSIKASDYRYCLSISDKYSQAQCLESVVRYLIQETGKADKEICRYIKEATYKNDCYKDIGIATNDVTVCDYILDSSRKGTCISYIAEQTSDKRLCGLIQDVSSKDYCYKSIGIKTRDIELCNLISINSIKKDCIGRTQGYTEYQPVPFSTPPVGTVDLKVNESDNPAPIRYNSKILVSWKSTGDISYCRREGSYIPTTKESVLWTDNSEPSEIEAGTALYDHSPSGSMELYARHNTFGYSPSLSVGIICYANGFKQVARDKIEISIER